MNNFHKISHSLKGQKVTCLRYSNLIKRFIFPLTNFVHLFKLWTILEFEFEGSEDISDDYLDDIAPDEGPDDEYNNYGAQRLTNSNSNTCPGGKSRVKSCTHRTF